MSDPHFGHQRMAEVWRGFDTILDHDEALIANWNKVVTKRDIVIVPGDISMNSRKNIDSVRRLNGTIKIIAGNHDSGRDLLALLELPNVLHILGSLTYKDTLITHIPIHPSEFEYRVDRNLHGHTHARCLDDIRYVNISADNLGLTPVLLDTVISKDYVTCPKCSNAILNPNGFCRHCGEPI